MARLFTFATGEYPVVELNFVASVRTGELVSQSPMSSALAANGAHQGQLLVVDKIGNEIKYPSAGTDYVYLHASEEQIYEEHLGRKSFYLKSGKVPRLYKLHKDDVFETNAVDKGAYADLAAVSAAITAKTISAVPMTSGDIKLLATASLTTEQVVLTPKAVVTLPNGGQGIQFVVAKA